MMTGKSIALSRASVLIAAMAMLIAFAGCGRSDPNRVQGYVEGEYVYVASPLAGQLESLAVKKGEQVKAGAALFALDSVPEKAEQEEAQRRLAQACASLEDARKGKRPSEIDSVNAQLLQARAALSLAEQEFSRQQRLIHDGATAKQDFDRAQSTLDEDRQRVAQLEADLRTAQLGSRTDQVLADEADVRALEAAVAKANWDLAQKHQAAPLDGLVFDTLYREGEWVAAGHPVVALLPPQNIKVRAFVPETRVGVLRPGESVHVYVDGAGAPFVGKVSFISPRAEYTPPVIYSRESREKLVFMIEAVFDPPTAAKLHPGQPVDVELTH